MEALARRSELDTTLAMLIRRGGDAFDVKAQSKWFDAMMDLAKGADWDQCEILKIGGARLRKLHQLGGCLREIPRMQGTSPGPGRKSYQETLSDLRMKPTSAARYEALNKIPRQQVEAYIDACLADERLPSMEGCIRTGAAPLTRSVSVLNTTVANYAFLKALAACPGGAIRVRISMTIPCAVDGDDLQRTLF